MGLYRHANQQKQKHLNSRENMKIYMVPVVMWADYPSRATHKTLAVAAHDMNEAIAIARNASDVDVIWAKHVYELDVKAIQRLRKGRIIA